MKSILCCIAFLSAATSLAAADALQPFLSQSGPVKLEAFMDFVDMPKDDRPAFQTYYQNLIEEMHTMRSDVKKNLRKQKLEQQGVNSLEIKQPDWARSLTGMLKKDHPLYSNAHTFVIRYAALESYYEQKARRKNSTWAKVQGFFSHTKETVAGWFSSFRPKRKVV